MLRNRTRAPSVRCLACGRPLRRLPDPLHASRSRTHVKTANVRLSVRINSRARELRRLLGSSASARTIRPERPAGSVHRSAATSIPRVRTLAPRNSCSGIRLNTRQAADSAAHPTPSVEPAHNPSTKASNPAASRTWLRRSKNGCPALVGNTPPSSPTAATSVAPPVSCPLPCRSVYETRPRSGQAGSATFTTGCYPRSLDTAHHPHPGAGPSSTLLTSALPGAQYEPLRLPSPPDPCGRLGLSESPTATGLPCCPAILHDVPSPLPRLDSPSAGRLPCCWTHRPSPRLRRVGVHDSLSGPAQRFMCCAVDTRCPLRSGLLQRITSCLSDRRYAMSPLSSRYDLPCAGSAESRSLSPSSRYRCRRRRSSCRDGRGPARRGSY